SRTVQSQAEELAAFIETNLGAAAPGRCIIFYSAPEKKDELAALFPAEYLLLVRVERYQPEFFLSALARLAQDNPTPLYLFPGGYSGSELAVRLACRLGGSSLTAVQKLEAAQEPPVCCKTVYSGYLQARLELRRKPYCLSIARGGAGQRRRAVKVREMAELDMRGAAEASFCRELEFKEAGGGGLEQASFIMAAGRGVGSKEKTEKFKQAAAELGAAFGVSRPVAMNAWAPLSALIGASGVISRPRLCIAAGVSGAAAFYAGIEKSKHIVALNIDEFAPLVQTADVAVIDDYEAVLEELLRLIRQERELKAKGE
ncbi:MAG: electron transfer flavoprotein subunit alpha/FixB family protein, partial [Dethiobacteria bacterium]